MIDDNRLYEVRRMIGECLRLLDLEDKTEATRAAIAALSTARDIARDWTRYPTDSDKSALTRYIDERQAHAMQSHRVLPAWQCPMCGGDHRYDECSCDDDDDDDEMMELG